MYQCTCRIPGLHFNSQLIELGWTSELLLIHCHTRMPDIYNLWIVTGLMLMFWEGSPLNNAMSKYMADDTEWLILDLFFFLSFFIATYTKYILFLIKLRRNIAFLNFFYHIVHYFIAVFYNEVTCEKISSNGMVSYGCSHYNDVNLFNFLQILKLN